MKIGILGTRGIPNRYGGFEQLAQFLSEGLAKRNHDVWVYCPHHHPYQREEWNGVRLIYCRDPEKSLGTAGQFVYDLNCIKDAHIRGFDIMLHLGYTSDAVWHRKWPGNTVHIINMDGLEWKRSKYNRWTRRFLNWSEGIAVKYADALVADSPGIQEYLLAKYNRPSTSIAYGATVFNYPEESVCREMDLEPNEFFLLIARMEPENNIETIIKGFMGSNSNLPLIIIGDTSNKFGRYLTRKYSQSPIRFIGSIYDLPILNNLRYYCKWYFHGHSVGGTNPSLLEAMACQSNIAAHDNIFNRSVLNEDAEYFQNEKDIAKIILKTSNDHSNRKASNLKKITEKYNWNSIINSYETLMLDSLASGR